MQVVDTEGGAQVADAWSVVRLAGRQTPPGAADHGNVQDTVQEREVVHAHVVVWDGLQVLDQGVLLSDELRRVP